MAQHDEDKKVVEVVANRVRNVSINSRDNKARTTQAGSNKAATRGPTKPAMIINRAAVSEAVAAVVVVAEAEAEETSKEVVAAAVAEVEAISAIEISTKVLNNKPAIGNQTNPTPAHKQPAKNSKAMSPINVAAVANFELERFTAIEITRIATVRMLRKAANTKNLDKLVDNTIDSRVRTFRA